MNLDERLIMATLAVQSYPQKTRRMRKHVHVEARAAGARTWTTHGNVYAVKGTPRPGGSYPCFVAHTDTVHRIRPDAQFGLRTLGDWVYAVNPLSGKATGIGGDDKVGVAIALQALRDLPCCKAVFFRDEEWGCLGADRADVAFFDDVGYVIECDRRGIADVVFDIGLTNLASDEFRRRWAPVMRSYQRVVADVGVMTDVQSLARHHRIPISMCNVACGYYRPHSADEYVDLRDVRATVEMLGVIIGKLGQRRYPCARPELPSWDDWDDGITPWHGSRAAPYQHCTCGAVLYGAATTCWACRADVLAYAAHTDPAMTCVSCARHCWVTIGGLCIECDLDVTRRRTAERTLSASRATLGQATDWCPDCGAYALIDDGDDAWCSACGMTAASVNR